MDDEDEAEEDEDYDGVAFLETSSRKRQTLNPNYAYLDTCSTYHQVINKHHVTDVRESKRLLRGQCNAGTSTISRTDTALNPIPPINTHFRLTVRISIAERSAITIILA